MNASRAASRAAGAFSLSSVAATTGQPAAKSLFHSIAFQKPEIASSAARGSPWLWATAESSSLTTMSPA